MNAYRCPLCSLSGVSQFHRDARRDYLRCSACRLVFVPESQHLSIRQEKAVYDLHRNQDDEGYRRFLSRLAQPLLERLPPAASGLDYGCGPGPVLATMLEKAGHQIAVYDPFYANHPERLRNTYDFVTCTEVVEHFRQPGSEFQRLFSLLRDGGKLGIMTKQVIDASAFVRWHYKNDPTHVCFFCRETFNWLAELYRCRVEFIGKDVIMFSV